MSIIEEGKYNRILIEKFKTDYLPQKYYFRHSDIDIYVNIVITQLLNYNLLLSDEMKNFFKENFLNNYKYNHEILFQKELAFENKQFDNSILSFEIPEFEIYFVAKLFIDGMERKPECQTKLLFNSKNIDQYISMRYKYKDLTNDSYIDLELYSMQIPEDRNLLGKTRIYLFDEKMNLNQGRHIFKLAKINKNEKFTEEQIELNDVEKEIDYLINNYYSHIDEENKNIFSDTKEKKLNLNNYYYNPLKKTLDKKPQSMMYFESALSELLSKTNDSFVVIKYPTFPNAVIYEEDISEDYKQVFTPELSDENSIFSNWVNDPYINIARHDFDNKDNPISEKFSSLMRENDNDDDLYARDIRLNPVALHRINKLLNTPDFIKLDNNDVALFWNYRYDLKNNQPRALTKIMNSVKWGNLKSENEFIKNILKQWKKIEISDILFMLSRKFSVNNLYPNTDIIINNNFEGMKESVNNLYPNTDIIINNNFEGMKELRKFAVTKLGQHSNEELNFILLQLVQAIRYEDISTKNVKSPLVTFLIERCCKDAILSSSFYWFIECESNMGESNNSKNITEIPEIIKIYGLIRDKFFEDIKKNKDILEIINNEVSFKAELVKISSILSKVNKVENKKNELRNLIDFTEKKEIQDTEYYLPINPQLKVKGAISSKCTVFKSAKCPVKYSFNVTEDTKQNNHNDDKDHISIMFKYGDDLRQDQLILQMINYMDSLLKNVHLDFQFTIYKTLATSKSDGFVEFVPNSTTIYDIIKTKTMREYYLELSNHNDTVYNQKLENYINSCAGYCVVTYLLGIGDRHLQNLMIDKNGRLFHIDFGYILGKDPKPLPPPIKLCKEMVELMGGKGSKGFNDFQQKCVNAYWVLRENARVIVNMFYLMIDSGIPELNNIDNLEKLHEKFVPQKNKQEAATYILDNLKESVDALMPVVMETFHAWAQYWKT